MIKCPNCGDDLLGNPKFCTECGEKILKTAGFEFRCRNCAASFPALTEKAKYCPQCRSTNIKQVIQ